MGDTYNSFCFSVGVACLAWNASMKSEPERSEMVKQGIDLFKENIDTKTMNEIFKFTMELIGMKLQLFSNDQRLMANFEVTETKDNFHVFVMSLETSG